MQSTVVSAPLRHHFSVFPLQVPASVTSPQGTEIVLAGAVALAELSAVLQVDDPPEVWQVEPLSAVQSWVKSLPLKHQLSVLPEQVPAFVTLPQA